ncbi:phage baseplate assembly protein [Camelimonas sp. ID_303_24]
MIRIEITSVRDDGDLQLISGRTQAGEEIEDAVRIQGHGLTTHPPVGAIGIVVFLYGRRDMPSCIGIEDPSLRVKNQQAGGATLYDHKGNALRLSGDGGSALVSEAGNTVVGAKAGQTRVGGDGSGSYVRVMTESGPSSTVFARL